MQSLYSAAQTTRQSFHQWKQPSLVQQERVPIKLILQLAQKVQLKYLPGAGARTLYYYIRNKLPEYKKCIKGIGKHAFEAICLQNGMRIEYRRFVPKTTVRGDFVFPNLIYGKHLDDINQVWVSDISYLYGTSGTLLGYATSLIDIYSRRLLGLTFSQGMFAKATVQVVLKQALEERKQEKYNNLIFHSDGGKQYIESSFLKTLNDHKIVSSMAENCYENAFAEAFNDTLKNHMLHKSEVHTFIQLKKLETHFKYCYNFNKPHSSLRNLTPVEFEQYIQCDQSCQRTILEIKDKRL
jgi:putative transposase